jgi:hypothetical protein
MGRASPSAILVASDGTVDNVPVDGHVAIESPHTPRAIGQDAARSRPRLTTRRPLCSANGAARAGPVERGGGPPVLAGAYRCRACAFPAEHACGIGHAHCRSGRVPGAATEHQNTPECSRRSGSACSHRTLARCLSGDRSWDTARPRVSRACRCRERSLARPQLRSRWLRPVPQDLQPRRALLWVAWPRVRCPSRPSAGMRCPSLGWRSWRSGVA